MRRMRRDGGITLIGWILMIVAALTLMALAVPAYVRAGRHDALVGCRGHLKAMFDASLSPTLGKEPPALRSAYWTRLAATQPPLVSAETLRCPMVSPEIQRPTDYLGPVKNPASLAGEEPIGCDMEENHGEHGKMGGTVLYKSGLIRSVHPVQVVSDQDPWREAARNKCAP
jgi:hypothetical protein